MDLERRRTIDILPERQADTFARWLREHPGVEVIGRDRGGADADGGRQGAPGAVPVADRFRLRKNVGAVLERLVQRRHAALREAATAVDREVAAATAASTAPPPTAEPPIPATVSALPPSTAAPHPASQAQQLRQAARARRLAHDEEVAALSRQGLGPASSARQVGPRRQTVARWLRAGSFPERAPVRPRWQRIMGLTRRSGSPAKLVLRLKITGEVGERAEIGRESVRLDPHSAVSAGAVPTSEPEAPTFRETRFTDEARRRQF